MFPPSAFFLGARKRAHRHAGGSATVARRSKELSFDSPTRYKSIGSATLGASRALAPAMHFSGARGVGHEWNAKAEPSIGFSIAVLRQTLALFHPGNRLLDAQQDSSDLTAGGPLDEAD